MSTLYCTKKYVIFLEQPNKLLFSVEKSIDNLSDSGCIVGMGVRDTIIEIMPISTSKKLHKLQLQS